MAEKPKSSTTTRRPRKTAAKKAAAAKPPPPLNARRHPWGFGEGKYLSTVSINRNGVSSGASVIALRAALGLRPGIYDEQVRSAVIAAQEAAGAPATGVVAESDWDLIVNSPQRLEPQAPADED